MITYQKGLFAFTFGCMVIVNVNSIHNKDCPLLSPLCQERYTKVILSLFCFAHLHTSLHPTFPYRIGGLQVAHTPL
jgi:hypothetical protein